MVNLHDSSSGQLTLERGKKIVKGNTILKETNFTNLFEHVQKSYITVANRLYYYYEWMRNTLYGYVAAALTSFQVIKKYPNNTAHDGT